MGHRMSRFAQEDDYERSVPDMVLFKRMVNYITRQRRETALLVIAITASTSINLLPPYMYSLVIDKYIKQLDTRGLYLLGIGFIIIYLLNFITQYVQQYLINWLGSRLELNMRMDMFKHLQRLSLDFYAKREVGSIVSRGSKEVDKITE